MQKNNLFDAKGKNKRWIQSADITKSRDDGRKLLPATHR